MIKYQFKYPKIPHIHKKDFDINEFVGNDIIITEKIDGKNFRIFYVENVEPSLFFGSCNLLSNNGKFETKAFKKTIEYINNLSNKDMWNVLKLLKDEVHNRTVGFILYGEYVGKNMENIMLYERTPKHNFILFDVVVLLEDYSYLIINQTTRLTLFDKIADMLNFETVPLVFMGSFDTKQQLLSFCKEQIKNRKSILGGLIEGLVIKKIPEIIFEIYEPSDRIEMRTFKVVREDFKEAISGKFIDKSRKAELKTITDVVDFIADKFITKGRVFKAMNLLQAEGGIEHFDKTATGKVIKTVLTDILEEENEEIMSLLYKVFKKKFGQYSKRVVDIYFNILTERLGELK